MTAGQNSRRGHDDEFLCVVHAGLGFFADLVEGKIGNERDT